jgi:hypothetical protein
MMARINNRKRCARFVISLTAALLVFFIQACMEEPIYYPVLATIPAADSNITASSAKLYAEVTSVGNQKIVEYGIEVYEKSITNPVAIKGYPGAPDIGVYNVGFTGLKPNTLYYFRAYALINTANFYSQNALHQFTTKSK